MLRQGRNERAVGAKEHKDRLVDYVCTAIKGAIDFEFDVASLHEDLRWIENLP
jgi:hypothetical protein